MLLTETCSCLQLYDKFPKQNPSKPNTRTKLFAVNIFWLLNSFEIMPIFCLPIHSFFLRLYLLIKSYQLRCLKLSEMVQCIVFMALQCYFPCTYMLYRYIGSRFFYHVHIFIWPCTSSFLWITWIRQGQLQIWTEHSTLIV